MVNIKPKLIGAGHVQFQNTLIKMTIDPNFPKNDVLTIESICRYNILKNVSVSQNGLLQFILTCSHSYHSELLSLSRAVV